MACDSLTQMSDDVNANHIFHTQTTRLASECCRNRYSSQRQNPYHRRCTTSLTYQQLSRPPSPPLPKQMQKKFFLVSFIVILLLASSLCLGAALDYKCPQECQCSSLTIDRVHVVCNLFSIGDWSDFRAVQVNNTAWLTVRCNAHGERMPSSLEPLAFSHLLDLTQLDLLDCTFTRLPPRAFARLGALRQLTIATRDPRSSLQIDDGAFSGLPRLERLELMNSNVQRISDEEYCRIGQTVRQLDLSGNLLTQLPPARCMPRLVTLAMRTNALKDNIIVTQTNGAAYTQLEQLDLSDNLIEQLPPKVLLESTPQLKNLSLAGNKLASIGELTLTQLEVLDLSRNAMKSIPTNAFFRLSALRSLNLSRNALSNQWISGELLLRSLLKLEQLDLSYNQLSNVDNEMLRNLLSLRQLDLSNNRIEVLAPSAFEVLHNLELLDLSSNQLSQNMPAMNTLYKLSELDLADNVIRELPRDFLSEAKKLQKLDLCGNQLIDLPATLGSRPNAMQRLQTLRLCRNRFRSLPFDGMQSLTALEELDLSGNEFQQWRFPGCLPDKPRLRVLNLAQNHIGDTFYSNSTTNGKVIACASLEQLDLSNNVLTSLPELRFAFPTLRQLNVSYNRLTTLNWSSMPGATLQVLAAAANQIVDLQGGDPDVYAGQLQHLDLSNNRITRLTQLPSRQLKFVDLRENLISSFVARVFALKPNLREVHLESNRIEQLEESDISITPASNIDFQLPKLFLRNNPLQCHCSMTFLLDIGQRNSPRQQQQQQSGDSVFGALGPIYTPPARWFFDLADFGQLECRDIQQQQQQMLPTFPKLLSMALMNSTEMLCRYDEQCSAASCCEFSACDCKKTCPNGCACYHDDAWSVNIVDCSAAVRNSLVNGGGAGGASGGGILSTVPLTLPIDVTEVRLDGNNLRQLKQHSFLARSRLRTLFLNQSQISEIRSQAFQGLYNLQSLYLQDNSLTQLDGHEFREFGNDYSNQQQNLRTLDLSNNQLTRIAPNTFTNLTQLKYLSVRGNRLIDLSELRLPEAVSASLTTTNNIIDDNSVVVGGLQVDIANNPWDCGCDDRTGKFQAINNWLEKFGDNVVRLITVQCVDTPPAPLANIMPRRGGSPQLIMRALALKERRCELNYEQALQMLNDAAAAAAAAAAANNAAAAGTRSKLLVSDDTTSRPNSSTAWIIWALGGVAASVVLVLVALAIIYRYELQQACLHGKFSSCRFSAPFFSGVGGGSGGGGASAAVSNHGGIGVGIYGDDSESNRPYDAFISYADADANMVLGELVPRLELGSPKYRLFVPCRDYRHIPHSSRDDDDVHSASSTPSARQNIYIHQSAKSAEAVLQAGQQSKRAIVVISASFLAYEWSRLEYRTAHQQLFKDRRQKIIFICVDDVDPVEQRNLDVDLRIWMKRHPCLKWGEKLFWKKLYFAMPDATPTTTATSASAAAAAMLNCNTMLFANNTNNTLPHPQQQQFLSSYPANVHHTLNMQAYAHQLHHQQQQQQQQAALSPIYQHQFAAAAAAAAAANGTLMMPTMNNSNGVGGFPPVQLPPATANWLQQQQQQQNLMLAVAAQQQQQQQQALYGLSQHTYASGSMTGVPAATAGAGAGAHQSHPSFSNHPHGHHSHQHHVHQAHQHQHHHHHQRNQSKSRAESATTSTSTSPHSSASSSSSSPSSSAACGEDAAMYDTSGGAVYASPAEIGAAQQQQQMQHQHSLHHYHHQTFNTQQQQHPAQQFLPALPPPNISQLISPPSSTTPLYFHQQQQQQQVPPDVPPHHPSMMMMTTMLPTPMMAGAPNSISSTSSASSAESASAAGVAHSQTNLLSNHHYRNQQQQQQQQQLQQQVRNFNTTMHPFHQKHQHQQQAANGLPITDL